MTLFMRWIYKFPLRLRSLFQKSRVEQEVTDELRFHLERLIEEKVGKEMTPEEACYAALRELGGVEQIKEECRDMRRVNYIESFFQAVRYGLSNAQQQPSLLHRIARPRVNSHHAAGSQHDDRNVPGDVGAHRARDD
ncbi:MAG: permease prefix domain 1-containing protein [Terriglobia bacterium]